MQKKNEVRLFDLFPHFKENEETKNPLPTWKKVHSDVLMARKMHSSILLKNFIVILGGVNDSDSFFLFDHIVLFNIEKNKFSLISTSGEIPIPRTKNSTCALSENEIIIFGGEFGKDNLTNDVHKLTIDFNKSKT